MSPPHNTRSNRPTVLELLPGGKYLAAMHDTRIELWHVATSALIWCLPTRWLRYNFELLDYADTALIAFAAFDSPGTINLKVLSIDLNRGESTEVFTINLPEGTVLAETPILCDGFLLCGLIHTELRGNLYLLIHWHENQAVVLRDFSPTRPVGSSPIICIFCLT
jgi:hypothetical protein